MTDTTVNVLPPKDSSSKQGLSKDVQKWVELFNKVKGWESLDMGDAEESLYEHYSDKVTNAKEEYGTVDDLTEARDAKKKELDEKKVSFDAADPGQDKDKLAEEIEDLEAVIKAQTANIEMVEKLTDRASVLYQGELVTSEDFQKLTGQIKVLRKKVAKGPADLSKLDPKKRETFFKVHEGLVQNIANARKEMMSFEQETETGSNTVEFPVLDHVQFQVLHGMLEQSLLLVDAGNIDMALTRLQQTNQTFIGYRNDRTGATATVSEHFSFNPAIEKQVAAAEKSISELKRGIGGMTFVDAAEVFEAKLLTLKHLLVDASEQGLDDAGKKWEFDAANIAVAADGASTKMYGIVDALQAARDDADLMELNGFSEESKDIFNQLDSFNATDDVDETLKRAELIRADAANNLAATNKRALDAANIDPEKLQETIDGLNKRFDALLVHKKDGSVATIKDRVTGLQKAKKENKHLPRETINEIELRIRAAEQLMASDSIDALRLEHEYLEKIGDFLEKLERDPKIFKDFKDRVDVLEGKIKTLESDYELYEITRRLKLKEDFDTLKTKYPTQDQKTTTDKLDSLEETRKKLKTDCAALKARKKDLNKEVSKVRKTFDKVGKALQKRNKDKNLKFDGYHGELVAKLEEIETKIARHTKDSFDSAQKELVWILVKLNAMLDYIAKLESSKKSGTLEASAMMMSKFKEFEDDARKGQAKHDADEAKKGDFDKAVSKLEQELKALKDKIKTLGTDGSDADALETKLDALKTEIDGSKAYVDGLSRIDEMQTECVRLSKEVDDAAKVAEAGITKGAELCAAMINSFRRYASEFITAKVEPAGEGDSGNQLDAKSEDGKQVYDRKALEAYLKSIVDAVPATALTELLSNAKTVEDKTADAAVRKLARKDTLRGIRGLMAVFSGFKPVAHFKTQPFDTQYAEAAALARALARLEVQVLTAIK